uniref:Uncharacterized protein n=1 Tax=Anguilla anguilla TaxID=7936 RepID=A0A0E9SC29_ANGAN
MKYILISQIGCLSIWFKPALHSTSTATSGFSIHLIFHVSLAMTFLLRST